MGHASTLLLFNISGFFDNIHLGWITQILCDKGFPTNICDWVLFFPTKQQALLKLGNHISNLFTLSYGTP